MTGHERAYPHEVQTQQPKPQRLMMAGQNRARQIRQIVEAFPAAPTQVALAVRLRVVAALADHLGARALRTPNALRPAVLSHQLKALRVIEQGRKVDQLGHGSGHWAGDDAPHPINR
jgi:hypothetical protein